METPWTRLGAFGTVAGVLLAFITRSGEIEKRLLRLLSLFTLANITLISWAPAWLGTTSSTSEIVLRVLWLDVALLTGLFGNIVVYRLFFHRLRNMPGPIAARVSRHYAAYHTIKDAQMHYTVQRLHQQYGDVVRIGIVNPPSTLPQAISTDGRNRVPRGFRLPRLGHPRHLWTPKPMHQGTLVRPGHE